jgi:hypothetical protein
MRDHPSESIVTIFDYATGVACISVGPIYPTSSLMLNYLGVNCLEHVSRALRSGGRMQLHLMALPDDGQIQNVPPALEQFALVRWSLQSSDEEAELAGY